jgi:hypothetical protein
VIGYLDCYSGVSGDMVLGALVDAGLPLGQLETVVSSLGLSGEVRVAVEDVDRSGLRATRVRVETLGRPVHRRLPAVTAMVEASALPEPVRAASVAVLTRIAEAEGRVHGRPTADVELHEVGSLDAIVDVVGVVAGLAALEVDELFASSLPVSPSEIAEGGHGALPGPAPATLALLAAARAPIRPFGAGYELVTPTGAALVTMLARFEQPAMRLERIGCGTGAVETPWPNVLRLWLGTGLPATPATTEGRIVLETNLDDMSPQLLAPVSQLLFAAGALDVQVAPQLMKKGRAGWLVTVIGRAPAEAALAEILLRETTTLGVRVHDVRRYEAERRQTTVDTRYGPVEVKLKLLGGEVVGAMPEFESVLAAARTSNAGLAVVHAVAAAAATALLSEPAPPAANR